MKLPPYPQDWIEPWHSAYLERAAIMWAEGVPEPEKKAEADVRRQAEGIGQSSIFDDITPLRKLGGAA